MACRIAAGDHSPSAITPITPHEVDAKTYDIHLKHRGPSTNRSWPGSSARKAWCARPGDSESRASGPDRGRLQHHPARPPHQIELEVHEFLRAVRVRLGAYADEAIAQPALQRAEPLPFQPVDRVSGRMRLRDGTSGQLLAPVVVVALRTGKIKLALPAIKDVSSGIKKRLHSLVDRDLDRHAARLPRDIGGDRQ